MPAVPAQVDESILPELAGVRRTYFHHTEVPADFVIYGSWRWLPMAGDVPRTHRPTSQGRSELTDSAAKPRSPLAGEPQNGLFVALAVGPGDSRVQVARPAMPRSGGERGRRRAGRPPAVLLNPVSDRVAFTARLVEGVAKPPADRRGEAAELLIVSGPGGARPVANNGPRFTVTDTPAPTPVASNPAKTYVANLRNKEEVVTYATSVYSKPSEADSPVSHRQQNMCGSTRWPARRTTAPEATWW